MPDLGSPMLGAVDADDDRKLAKYYVDLGHVTSLRQRHHYIVVGAKGTGKSALKHILADEPPSKGDFVVKFDESSNYRIDLADLYAKSPAAIAERVCAYLAAAIVHVVLESSDIPQPARRKLESLKDRIPIIKRLLAPLKIKVPFVEYGIGDLFEKRQVGDWKTILDPAVGAAVSQSLGLRRLWLLVDDIDRVFTSDDADGETSLIEGVLTAARKINLRMYEEKVCVVLLLRSEIYVRLEREMAELDKSENYVWMLSWRNGELEDFLAKRIKFALDVHDDEPTWRTWTRLFECDDEPSVRELQAYVFGRLINGPRDLLTLVDNFARKHAHAEGSGRIALRHIDEAAWQYGKRKLEQVNANFSALYPDVDKLIERLFANQNGKWTRASLTERIRNMLANQAFVDAFGARWIRTLTPAVLINALYVVGAIGYFDKSDSRYLFIGETGAVTQEFGNATKFAVHLAFQAFLRLK